MPFTHELIYITLIILSTARSFKAIIKCIKSLPCWSNTSIPLTAMFSLNLLLQLSRCYLHMLAWHCRSPVNILRKHWVETTFCFLMVRNWSSCYQENKAGLTFHLKIIVYKNIKNYVSTDVLCFHWLGQQLTIIFNLEYFAHIINIKKLKREQYSS